MWKIYFGFLIIIVSIIIFSTNISESAHADGSYDGDWHKYYLVGKFVGSDPPEPNKIFVFQYKITNGTIKSISSKDGVLAVNVHGTKNGVLEIKFPRNYPYTNTPKNWPDSISHADIPFLLINGAEELRYSSKITDCFFTYRIPFSNDSKIELIWTYLLSNNLYPHRGDDVPQYCIAQTIAENLSPLQQIQAGVSNQDVQCAIGFEFVIKTSNSSPACVKPETKIKLIERGWAKPL